MYMFDKYLKGLVEDKKIPAAVLMIHKEGVPIFSASYGEYQNNENQTIQADLDTMFDLASLTKVMATLPSVLLLHQKGKVSVHDKVKTYFPTFKYNNITIKHLLQHTSGLNADLPKKERIRNPHLLDQILDLPLISEPGSQVTYSDLGMILLGKIVEKVSGLKLNDVCEQNLFKPWNMNNTMFSPPCKLRDNIASTEIYQKSFIHGEVHDEKSYQLHGISGSAGLFSVAKDIATYINYWLYPETQTVLSKATLDLAFEDIKENRGLGFEVWTGRGEELSCSKRWNNGSFGHTGFTGTSVWADPLENLSVVFLTNVVHFGRNHELSKIRKVLHSMIAEELISDS